jgi:hypothetical protein
MIDDFIIPLEIISFWKLRAALLSANPVELKAAKLRTARSLPLDLRELCVFQGEGRELDSYKMNT